MGSLACLSPYSFFTRRKSMPPEGAPPCKAVGSIMGSSLPHGVYPSAPSGHPPFQGGLKAFSQSLPCKGRWRLCRRRGFPVYPSAPSGHPPFQGGLKASSQSLPSGDPAEAQPSGGFGGERRSSVVTKLFAFRRKRGIRSLRRRKGEVAAMPPEGFSRRYFTHMPPQMRSKSAVPTHTPATYAPGATAPPA